MFVLYNLLFLFHHLWFSRCFFFLFELLNLNFFLSPFYSHSHHFLFFLEYANLYLLLDILESGLTSFHPRIHR